MVPTHPLPFNPILLGEIKFYIYFSKQLKVIKPHSFTPSPYSPPLPHLDQF